MVFRNPVLLGVYGQTHLSAKLGLGPAPSPPTHSYHIGVDG